MKRALAAVALLLAMSGAGRAAPCVMEVAVDSVVHPVTVDVLDGALKATAEQGCALLLIRLDTPGGFLSATREMIQRMLGSAVPVAAFVSPGGGRAASAGFFLLEAADVAAMAPGTHTGAAHPVLLAGTPDDVMKKKIENDAAAELRTLTDRRQRNSELAGKAVLESKSFTDQEALAQHLIDLIARDESDLLAQLNQREVRRFDGRMVKLELAGARLLPYEPTLRQRFQTALSDPNLALALTVLGALCLYVEYSVPGMIAPGVAGGILLLLGLSSLSVLPLNWVGVALLVLALALFVLEAKVTSHGVLGAGGALAMVLGALYLVDSPAPELRIRLSTALGLALPFALITGFLVTLVVRARRLAVSTGQESYAGQWAETTETLTPEGQVIFRGEVWHARARGRVEAGCKVRVTGVEGLTLHVEPETEGENNG